MKAQTGVLVCPLCGTENPDIELNCRLCGTNFKFASENPEEIDAIKQRKIMEVIRQHNINEARRKTDQGLPAPLLGEESYVDESLSTKLPWFDEGEDIVVDKIVTPNAMGQPIEVYYDEPFTGYGLIGFFENSIGFKYPRRSGYTQGFSSFGGIDIDGDGVTDTEDIGCCLLIGIVLLISWFTSRWVSGHRKEIKWSSRMPYQDIQEISLRGRSLDILRANGKPRKLKMRVGSSDGERLYRELYLHYPAAISRWRGTLFSIIIH